MKKLLFLFLGLSLLILLTFGLFGDHFTFMFSGEKGREFFARADHWTGPLGAGLLISDLVLPIPTTVIIGSMGAVLGWVEAAIWGWIGLSLAGLTGYGLARWGGEKLASRLASEEEQSRYRHLFNHWGGLAVILSRMLPVLPEVLSVLAGLYGMKFSRFAAAVILGSIPPALAFAWIGEKSVEHPGFGIWGFAGLMGIIWYIYGKVNKSSSNHSKSL